MAKDDRIPRSPHVSLLTLSVPAFMALAIFFSWIMLINRLKVPFYLYYQRTVFLTYVSPFLDPVIWLTSSALVLILFAAEARERSIYTWLSAALLWFGIFSGAMAELDIYPLAAMIAPLATLAGCVIGGIASFRCSVQRIRERFTLVFVLALLLLLLPVEVGSLSYYVLSVFIRVLGWVGCGRCWKCSCGIRRFL